MEEIQVRRGHSLGAHMEKCGRQKEVKARLVAEGYQGPDPEEGLVEMSGRGSPGSSHLRVISVDVLKNGIFEAWASKTPLRKLTSFAARYSFALPREGIRRAPIVFGSYRHWRMEAASAGVFGNCKSRRIFMSPCGGICCAPRFRRAVWV